MITIAREYAGHNPARWLVVPPVILLAIVQLSWRRVLAGFGVLLMAALLVVLLVGVAVAIGWLMGQILIWAGLI